VEGVRLLVQKAVYGKDGAHLGPSTPPAAYEYRVVYLGPPDEEDEDPVLKVVLPADERVVWVLP
jgi:hypothetical protein